VDQKLAGRVGDARLYFQTKDKH